jgi:hypothetical protein
MRTHTAKAAVYLTPVKLLIDRDAARRKSIIQDRKDRFATAAKEMREVWIQNDFGSRDPPEKQSREEQSEKKRPDFERMGQFPPRGGIHVHRGLLGRERSSQIGEKGVGREERSENTRT